MAKTLFRTPATVEIEGVPFVRNHIHGPVYDRNNVNLVRFYVVDNAVGTLNHFPDRIEVLFRDSSAGKRELSDLLRPSGKPINRKLRKVG